MSYRAVIFDLDGTLLDTIEDLADSMNRVLGRFGFPQHGVEAYKYFVGEGMEMLVRRALPAGRRDEATVEECVSAMRAEYGRHYADKTGPYAGIPELLSALSARGVSMAILSNKPHEATLRVVDRLLPGWRFAAIAGAKPSVPKKPDPTGALAIAAQLGIRPEAFAYVGDTGTDMKTARSAGMFGVGALWGFRTAEELLEAGAGVLIEHPSKLMRHMDSGAGG